MNFLVGIHIKDYNGTPNKKGEIDFVMTGIKVLKLPEMEFYDIMFKDYTDYSNDELYSLLDNIKGWKYSKRLYRAKDILYVSYYRCNTLHYGGISLFNYSDCIPLFCGGKLLSSKDDKLVITQSSDSVFYDVIIYINLTDYKFGIIVDDHYIFGDIKFKSLYYDFDYDYKKGSTTDELRESYDKSFIKIRLGDNAYSIKDVVPIDYEDGRLLIIGDKCILDINSRYNGKSIILPNGVKHLILNIDENELGTDATIVFPPSVQRLFLDSASIISYSDINTKFILSKKSNIDSILYYLYESTYYIPSDLKDIVEKHSINKNNLSYRDRVFDFIKNNKDEMVSLLSSLGLSISFYGD